MSSDSDCYLIEDGEGEGSEFSWQDEDCPNSVDHLDQHSFREIDFSKRRNYETPSECFDFHQLKKLQSIKVEDLSIILNLPFDICRALLRSFSWDRELLLETFMESPSKAYKKSNLENLLDPSKTPSFEEKSEFFCFICCVDSPVMKTLKLQCGDVFCVDCHDTYYRQSILEGKARKILCPGSCGTLVQDETLQKVVSQEIYARYEVFQNNCFVNDNKNLKWCPSPDCELALECDLSSSLASLIPSVFCLSGHSFCFSCHLEDHIPCLCDIAKRWLEKCEDDSETTNWLISNTKECPKCHTSIEKNGGCNRILCSHCRFQFCWSCMLSWSVHGYERGCNVFEFKEGTEKKLESRVSLERYLHYYNRFANHTQSSKLDQDLYSLTEEKMVALQEVSALSWIETQFLKTAVDTLVLCRNTLKWTYALAYYLQPDNQKSIFEDNQQDLELATEALSGFLEEKINLETLPQLKRNLQDKTVYVSQRRDILLTFLLQGYAENQWKFTFED